MFENPRRGRQARNFTTNVPKILDFKSSSEQIFSRKLSLGAPDVLQAGASGSQIHLPLPLFPNPNQPYRALSSIGGRLNDPTVGGQLAFHFQPFYIHTRNELVVSVR